MPLREFAGYKTIRNHMSDFAGNKNLEVDFLELQVISDGKLALARSVQHMTGKDSDGKRIDGPTAALTFGGRHTVIGKSSIRMSHSRTI